MSVQRLSGCKLCVRTVVSRLSYFLTSWFFVGVGVWKDTMSEGFSKEYGFWEILWVTGMQRTNY